MALNNRLTLPAFLTGLTLAARGVLPWGIETLNRPLKLNTLLALYYYICIYTWGSTVTVARAWSMKIIQKNKVCVVNTSAVFLVLKFAFYQTQQNKVQFLIEQFHKVILPEKSILHPGLSQPHCNRLTIASLLPQGSSPLPDATKRITESLPGPLCFSAGSCTVCDIHFATNPN